MTSVPDPQGWLQTDEDVFVVRVLANDPRAFPTESLLLSGPARGLGLADLEAVTARLRDECEWGLGREEDISKRGGGIGAESATVFSLVLGAIGTIPTIRMIFELLNRDVPPCPNRDDALASATWAIALQYASVERPALVVVREARHVDHWTFNLQLPGSNDDFEIDVYGSNAGTLATRVVWTNGDAWGAGPGRGPSAQ
jgi:hypothetical protein